jgi:XTP/dITP diphosphohydrolase
MIMDLVFASRNADKKREIEKLFADPRINLLTMNEAGIEGQAEEDGDDITENALKKARYAQRARPDIWVMSDDTGLFIDALGGKPGKDAAVWAGKGATPLENRNLCLSLMQDKDDRRAVFRCVIVLISPEGREYLFKGALHGTLRREPVNVDARPSYPYSPIFEPDGESMVLSEMSIEYENRISHRGQAGGEAYLFLHNEVLSRVA